jgi:hypothetical protein
MLDNILVKQKNDSIKKNVIKLFNNVLIIIVFVINLQLSSCKTKEVNPSWTSEIRWCISSKIIKINNNGIFLEVFVVDIDSLKNIDYEMLTLEDKGKYNREYSKHRYDTICFSVANGETINCITKSVEKCIENDLCNPDKGSSCETEIVKDYFGFRITIKHNRSIWRTENNNSYAFNIYSGEKLSYNIPIRIVNSISDYKISSNAVYITHGPRYRKHYLTKYEFKELITH